MNKPLLTATTLATGLTLEMYTPLKVIAEYIHEGTGYVSKLKITRTEDGIFLLCPTCHCMTRQLHKNEMRPGLACVDCLVRAEQKELISSDRAINVERRKVRARQAKREAMA